MRQDGPEAVPIALTPGLGAPMMTESTIPPELDRPPAERSLLDPAWIAAIWRRRKWLGVAVVVVPLTAAISIVGFMPQIYEAKATVLVDRQQVPEHFVQPAVTSALDTRLQTISQEILSRARLEPLIERFGLYADLRRRLSPEELVERMRDAIKLKLEAVDVRGQHYATVAFTLSFRGADPHTAARVANTLASFYVDENVKARERQATGTADFLRGQLAETKKRLDVQERQVSAFRRRHLGELPEQLETNLATLERLHLQLRLNADSQTRALERRNALGSQLAEAGAFASPGTPEAPDARLTRLRRELAQLQLRYSPKYPDVIATAAEVAEVERELEQSKASETRRPQVEAPTPYALRLREALGEVEAEQKTLRSEEGRLRSDIAAYQRRVETTPQREHEYKEMARDYETTREVYQSLLKRNEEAQIGASMEHHQKGEQFRLLDPAVPPRSPVANRFRLVAIAAVLSLGLGVLAVVVAEHIDTSFHSADDLRGFTPVSVLVSIPWVQTAVGLRRRQARLRTAMVLGCLGLAAVVGVSYAIAHGNEQIVWLLTRGRS